MDNALNNNDTVKVAILDPDVIAKYGNEYKQSDTSSNQASVQKESTTQKWYKWGDNDDLPKLINKASFSDPMPAMIDTLVSIDLGIDFGFFRKVKNGTEIIEEELLFEDLDQKTRVFFENNNISEYLEARAKNLRIFSNSFTSLYFGKGTMASKIVSLKNEHVQDCRVSFKKTGTNFYGVESLISKYIFLCGDWDGSNKKVVQRLTDKTEDNQVLEIWSADNSIESFAGKSRIIRHTREWQSGQNYYSIPKWYESAGNWLELASDIPIFQKSLLKNGIFPGYEIEIPAEIIAEKKALLNEKTEQDIKQEIIEGIKQNMKGSDKAGFTLTHITYLFNGIERKIKVTPVEVKASDKLFLESYDVCTRAISRAANVHPVLAGIALSSSLGSGSEIKYLYNWAVQKEKQARRRLLSDLDFIKKVNGWPTDVYFGIKNAKMLDTAIEKTGVGSVNPNQ